MLFVFLLLIFLSFLSIIIIIFSKNSIYGLWALISSFLLTSFIFFFLNIEFIGLILLIIYIGAIAILFLFGVMLLDLRVFSKKQENFSFNKIFWIVIITFKIYFFLSYYFLSMANLMVLQSKYILNDNMSLFSILNSHSGLILGFHLYNNYFYYFIISGLILLLALVGAISIVIKKNNGRSAHK
jgi:NADH-quinone oxidoreductase subunit J